MDSFGRPIVRQEDYIRGCIARLDRIDKEVREYLLSPINDAGDTDFRQKFFPVIHLNAYCQDRVMYPVNVLPAEYAMGYFSMKSGVMDADDMLHGFVNPVECPYGLRSDAMEMCKIRRLPMINKHKELHAPESTPAEFLEKLDALFGQGVELNVIKRARERYLFTVKSEVDIVQKAILWCQERVSNGNTQRPITYTVLPLATVFRLLSELVAPERSNINQIPDDAAAESILKHHKYMYIESMSCKWHQKENECAEYCSFNIARRMMYNILRYFSPDNPPASTAIPSHFPLDSYHAD